LRRGCGGTLGATPLRPAEVSGPTPPTSLRAQGAGRWCSHGRRGCTRPTGRPTPPGHPPRGRGNLPTRHPGGTPHRPRSTSQPDRRLAGMNAPPKLKPSAKTWDGVRGGDPGAQEASAESARGFYLGGFAYTDRLCPAAWAYDLQVQTCRYFLTGVVRPVSLYLWGSTYVRGPRRTARGVKSLQFILHSGIYHGHG
jgi:hypothetical protein